MKARFYCLKCKGHKENVEVTRTNPRKGITFLFGVCPDCDSKVSTIQPKKKWVILMTTHPEFLSKKGEQLRLIATATSEKAAEKWLDDWEAIEPLHPNAIIKFDKMVYGIYSITSVFKKKTKIPRRHKS